MSETLRGQLLVAAPILHDPNFHRTVVLVAEHGAVGVAHVSGGTWGGCVFDVEEIVRKLEGRRPKSERMTNA